MNSSAVFLVILMSFNILSCEDEKKIPASCPEHQEAFHSSCYEFVDVRRSFPSALAWCEESGGHLAFIHDEETQHFLQMHLDPGRDWWLGLAPPVFPELPDTTAHEAPLSWLDGSQVNYSNWVTRPESGASCGRILHDSAFQWEATEDCSQQLHSVCQFESGRSVVCAGHNASLQCGSGQVLEVDDAFYGRKAVHYCPSTLTPSTVSTVDQCSWIDILDLISGQCNGHQACQVAGDLTSLGVPCPRLGSYLSVEYHCKDGLELLASSVAAVFENVTISVKWLLHSFQESMICKLNTGDGCSVLLQNSEWSVVRKYNRSSVFALHVECTIKETTVTAHRLISIQEPITQFGAINCYARNLSLGYAHCKALLNDPLQIQVQVEKGTNVTYMIQKGEHLLASSSAVRGPVPQNMTVNPDMIERLGLGCHQLTLYASNMVTIPGVSTALEACVLENVAGLQASIIEEDKGKGSTVLKISISLQRGAPVLLLFSLNGGTFSFSETRELLQNNHQKVYQIRKLIHGPLQVKVTAWNAFSSMEVNMLSSDSCASHSALKFISDRNKMLTFNKKKKHVRIRRESPKINIIAYPSATASDYQQTITLYLDNYSADTKYSPQWACDNPCKCQGKWTTLNYTISGACLPDPFQYNKYDFSKININNNNPKDTTSMCITFQPPISTGVSLSCTQGCTPMNVNVDVKFQLNCTNSCPTVVWNIEDPGKITTEPLDCYQVANRKPLIQRQDGGTTYTVPASMMAKAQSDINKVTVVAYWTTPPGYATYTIDIQHDQPSTITKPTPKTPQPTPTPHGSTSLTTRDNTWPTSTKPTDKPTTTSSTTTSSTTRPTSTRSTSTISTTRPTSTRPTSTRSTTSRSTTSRPTQTVTANFASLNCSMSPPYGTVLDAFNITCKTKTKCTNCQYCLKTDTGDLICCSNESQMKSVFLPLGEKLTNYELLIVVTVQNGSSVSSTTITTQVKNPSSDTNTSLQELQSAVGSMVNLKEQGLLSIETVAQLFQSVSNILNSQSNQTQKDDRNKLREQMLNVIMDITENVTNITPQQVQVTARALTAIIQQGDEISPNAQKDAAILVGRLSSSLLMANNYQDKVAAVVTILKASSNILDFSSNKIISDDLLSAMNTLQSALLKDQVANAEPTYVSGLKIGLFVQRMLPASLQTKSLSVPQNALVRFSIPPLSSNILSGGDPVDVRILSFENNPFSWSGNGNISGTIGSLSLTRQDGSNIPVKNLAENIEILLQRPAGEQVNTSYLDLGNYSTTAINVPSSDSTLVLKMKPSEDPLPYKLLLGYLDYPTDTNYVAITDMPQPGATQDERYTWLLDPEALGGRIGTFYLVVRPIVGPGIKSISASLSITSIATHCKFWNESMADWSSHACKVGVETTALVVQCLCNHLTVFGSSFFVAPNTIDLSRIAQLFGTFAQNPVVVCFVGAISLVYLLTVAWARRKDIRDTAKLRVTLLQDNDPMDEYCYMLHVSTGHRRGASTSSQVTITVIGSEGESEPHHLADPERCVFERGAVDMFLMRTPFSLGELHSIRLWHDNSGGHPAWYVNKVLVQDLHTEQKWHCLCNSWLAIDVGECTLDRVFPVATEMELKRSSNMFYTKTSKDFNDGHLWFSVVNRPASSTFTRVQRVSCCFSLLLCTMLTSIMFYGVPKEPSEQTMDLGNFQFTWNQLMIGIESSLIMFPLNLLIVSIFRYTRPREISCCTSKPKALRKKAAQILTTQTMTSLKDVNGITVNSVLEDISRICHLLSRTMKISLPLEQSELKPGQDDISAGLCTLEHLIRKHSRGSNIIITPSTMQGSHKHNLCPLLPGVETPTEVEKNSIRTQYLYRQLCHIDRKLSLLGGSGFPNCESYTKAVQQVQTIKSLLKDDISTSSHMHLDQLTPSSQLVKEIDGNGPKAKTSCCHGGLPWYFVFVGWLLVIASSCVAGFFTMLYGLKFGKERSISWLISMVISFCESVFFTQPLKVICLAIFFAFVLKKVEEEDCEITEFVKPADPKITQTGWRNSRLYKPPPVVDIERMKQNKIKEQRAFALIREILTYIGFLCILLLVAYGQKDPNAFLLNQHIQQSFTNGYSDSMSLDDVFNWANTTLLSNLFGIYPGFITDGNSKLVGNARIRQVRVQKSSCQIAHSMQRLVPECDSLYSWETEDMGSYGPGWNLSMGEDVSQSHPTVWKYQTQAQLRAYPIWGIMALYRGGGFAVELGPDLENASSTLQDLFSNTWLDSYTRAIFVEFTAYNANVNLFCIVTLMLETSAIGAFNFNSELHVVQLYQSTGGLPIVVMTSEVLYFLFILYYMFLQGKLLKQQRWAYFRSKWNLLDLTIILLSWGALSVYIKRTLLGNQEMDYYHSHKDQFVSFYETAIADTTLGYLIACLVLLASVKLWHLLRLNSKMNMMTATLQRAWTEISSFLLIITVVILTYAVTFNVLYGWRIASYKTLIDAILTLICFQVGIFNYDEVLGCSPIIGGLLMVSCAVFMTFMVLNLFISVIITAFTQERLSHKPSEEEEIVDLMFMKLCSLFGVKFKDTKPFLA